MCGVTAPELNWVSALSSPCVDMKIELRLEVSLASVRKEQCIRYLMILAKE